MKPDFSQLWFVGWPLMVLLGGGLFSLITAVFPKYKRLELTSVFTFFIFVAAAAGFGLKWRQEIAFSAYFFVLDPYGSFLGLLLCLIGAVTTLVSYRYLKSQTEAISEFFSLLLFAVSGMVILVTTTQFLTLVLGLEVMSLSLYVLVGMRRLDQRSGEAAFKYFLLGSVATAFLLFGISLVYGATGTLDFSKWGELRLVPDMQGVFHWGALLILLGFAFKVAAVPFHFWAPDAYDGAPMPVTGFMATGVKVAAFGALIRVVQVMSPIEGQHMRQLFIGLSLATMVVGNVAALGQEHLKRILAYSSISHAGYLLLGMATLVSGDGFQGQNLSPILFYLASYSLLTLGAFAVLTLLSSEGREVNRLKDLDGLAETHPKLAACLGVFLISLAGIPPTAGFLAKYYLFSQAIAMQLYPLAVIGILASAASLYYYLAPVMRMYFRKGEKTLAVPQTSAAFAILMVLLLVGVFYLGIFPARPVALTRATQMLVPSGETALPFPVSPHHP